eukprot:4069743-Prymnesium_polylepis.2
MLVRRVLVRRSWWACTPCDAPTLPRLVERIWQRASLGCGTASTHCVWTRDRVERPWVIAQLCDDPESGRPHVVLCVRICCSLCHRHTRMRALCGGAQDQRILADEMSRTGLPDQQFELSPAERGGGPSVLVYYSPAFVRQLSPEHAKDALRLLAEVYRRARSLWPLQVRGVCAREWSARVCGGPRSPRHARPPHTPTRHATRPARPPPRPATHTHTPLLRVSPPLLAPFLSRMHA